MPQTAPSIQQFLEDSSPLCIETAIANIKQTHLPNNRWIGSRNRYRVDTIERIKQDLDQNNPSSIKPRQLAEYIAASVVIHCFDGWAFLSRSIGSILNGDVATAIHLAYYAELRAAISLLASQGIGIFKSRHFYLDDSGRYFVRNGSTHQIVWDLMKQWSFTSDKNRVLLDWLYIEQKSFAEWLSAAPFGVTSSSALAENWLYSWSLDLETFGTDDRTIRNEVSYRPTQFGNLQRVDIPTILSNLKDFWLCCEPSASGELRILDLYLLRSALRKAYRARTNLYPGSELFNQYIDATLANLRINNPSIQAFLTQRNRTAQNPLLATAKLKGKLSNGIIRPFPVIARSLLLLRIASASIRKLFMTTHICQSDVYFWMNQIGIDTNLWECNSRPEHTADLWEDILVALDDIDNWQSSNSYEYNHLAFEYNLSYSMFQLNKFERAGLWMVE